MRLGTLLLFSIALTASTSRAAESYDLDAPVPQNLRQRTFLSPEQANAYRQAMEKVVGHWGVVKNGQVTVTTSIPASMKDSAPLKVIIKDEKPIFNSIISQASSLNAGLPILSLTLAANEKATVTLTDTAQFLASGEPTDADWALVPPSTSSAKVVFIDAAIVSLLETSTMVDKGGTFDGLLSVLKIGTKVYQAKEAASTSTVISIGAKQSLASMLTGGSTTTMASSEGGNTAIPTPPKNVVSAAKLGPVVGMKFSDESIEQLMQ